MSPQGDAVVRLFTRRIRSCVRFIDLVRYPQGIRSFFLGSQLLRPGLRVLDAGCGTEYVPRDHRVAALGRLRGRLRPEGCLVWQGHLFEAAELGDALRRAGFATIAFGRFPLPFLHLALWGHVVEARG